MPDEIPAAALWPLRWDLLQRYRLIEIIALWEGRLTSNHLCDTFGIGRQQASKDINDYLKSIGAGNLVYDAKTKGHRPSPGFQPKVTSGVADEYLHLLSRTRELGETFEQLPLQVANTDVVRVPLRNVKPEIIRALVTAARDGRRVEVDYVSLQNPDREGRIIAPHTLVYACGRWHVRAFCEKNQDFRDFVLSRFRGTPVMEGPANRGSGDDAQWSRKITLKVIPDQRLSREQRKVVEQDYGMTRGVLRIETRAALAQYVLQTLHIDPHVINAKPEAQQIVVKNLDEVKPWLFE